MKNIFSLKGKTMEQTPDQFIISKSKCFSVCLKTKENHILLITLTHTNYLSQMQQYIALSSLFSSQGTTLSFSLLDVFFFWHTLCNNHFLLL